MIHRNNCPDIPTNSIGIIASIEFPNDDYNGYDTKEISAS